MKGDFDGTVGLVEASDKVIRHLGAGVLNANAPEPSQNSLKQTLYWNGKDDPNEYHKAPEEMKVRVTLGLKPEFEKNLGATNPRNLPGYVGGIAVGPHGVLVQVLRPTRGEATAQSGTVPGRAWC